MSANNFIELLAEYSAIKEKHVAPRLLEILGTGTGYKRIQRLHNIRIGTGRRQPHAAEVA